MRKRCSKIGLLLSLLMAGCAAVPSPPPDSPPASLPDELYFEIVTLPVGRSPSFRLGHDGVLVRTECVGNWHVKTLRRRVTAQAWQDFQHRIAPLHLLRWKRHYWGHSDMTDVGGWYLRWTSGQRHLLSEGHGAGPDPLHPAKTTEGDFYHPSGDTLLYDALDDLWTHSVTID